MSRWRAVARHPFVRAVGLALIVSAAVANPAAAHVNRTVGPYTILVTLIGEPFFPTNRAGFEIWIKTDGRPIDGLARTLHAHATRPGQDVALDLVAAADDGHYQAEIESDGNEFDPGSGGAWVFVLSGTIESTAVDQTFPVLFPAYPRIAAPSANPSTVAAPAESAPASPPLAVGLIAVVAAAGLLFYGVRRAKRRRGHLVI